MKCDFNIDVQAKRCEGRTVHEGKGGPVPQASREQTTKRGEAGNEKEHQPEREKTHNSGEPVGQ